MPIDEGSYGLPLPKEVRDLEPPLPNDSDLLIQTTEQGGVWTERAADFSPWVDSYGNDASVAQLVVEIPFEHVKPAVLKYLGHQWVDNNNKLRRVPPIVHPRWNHLRCRRVTNVQGKMWRGTTPVLPVIADPSAPRPPYNEYNTVQAVLQFEPLPFAMPPDEDIVYEWERWVWVRSEPGFQTLFIEGGSSDASFKFDKPLPNAGGKPTFSFGRTIPFAMPRILVTWFDVPTDFLSPPGLDGYYKNIFEGVQKLNNAEFMNFPAFSLLAADPIIELRPNPMPPFAGTIPTFLANITFVFHYLYPTNVGAGVVTNLGHNMAVYRGGLLPDGTEDPQSRKWFPASLNGAGVVRPYETYDYNLFFQRPT